LSLLPYSTVTAFSSPDPKQILCGLNFCLSPPSLFLPARPSIFSPSLFFSFSPFLRDRSRHHPYPLHDNFLLTVCQKQPGLYHPRTRQTPLALSAQIEFHDTTPTQTASSLAAAPTHAVDVLGCCLTRYFRSSMTT
jgi:hypothetical protein